MSTKPHSQLLEVPDSTPMRRLSAELGSASPLQRPQQDQPKKNRRSFLQMFLKDEPNPGGGFSGFKPFASPTTSGTSLNGRAKSVAPNASKSKPAAPTWATAGSSSSSHSRSKSDTVNYGEVPMENRSKTAGATSTVSSIKESGKMTALPVIKRRSASPKPSRLAPAAESTHAAEEPAEDKKIVKDMKDTASKCKLEVKAEKAFAPVTKPNSKDCLPRPVRKGSNEPQRKPTVNEQGRVRRRGAYGLDKLTRLDSFSSIYSIEPLRSFSTSSNTESYNSEASEKFSFDFDASSLNPTIMHTAEPNDNDDESVPSTPRPTAYTQERLPFHSLPRRKFTDRSDSNLSDDEDSIIIITRKPARIPTLKRIKTLQRPEARAQIRKPAREVLLETYADIVSELSELVPGAGDRRRLDMLGGSAAENMEVLLRQYSSRMAENHLNASDETISVDAKQVSAIMPFSVEFRNNVVGEPTDEQADENPGAEETFVDEYIVEHWLPLSPTTSSSSSSTFPGIPMDEDDIASPLNDFLSSEEYLDLESDEEGFSYPPSPPAIADVTPPSLSRDILPMYDGDSSSPNPSIASGLLAPPSDLEKRRGSDTTVVGNELIIEEDEKTAVKCMEAVARGRRVVSIVRRVVTLDRRGVPSRVKVDITPMGDGEASAKAAESVEPELMSKANAAATMDIKEPIAVDGS
ncbi:hypothetical protein HDU67_008162 [Dinochytrium kinnereticum]|nr:hypothetical protein HDU67_008162 [Dinochytrium kinnereticum]